MKIAYVTTYEANDRRAWSGTGYAIGEALKQAGLQIEAIGNLREAASLPLKLKKAAYKVFTNKTFIRNRSPRVLDSYARQVERALDKVEVEAVLSPSTLPITRLKTRYPIAFWTDSTFVGMVDFYPDFSNLCRETIRDGNRTEQEALSNCQLAIYASEWAAQTAREHYEVDAGKVKVAPFGANLHCERTEQDIQALIRNKEAGPCQLLFIGMDWLRKGGAIALKTAQILNAQGLEAELHIVGCQPPVEAPGFVRLHGYVFKSSEAGIWLLERLFSQAHFRILPSRAEAYGVVFAEASSYGVPSLATRVGGILTAVEDGRNGKLFALEAGAESYAETIQSLWSAKESYRELASQSFQEYAHRLNWATAGGKVREYLQKMQGMA
jgi:glycosyltransferase involved in cell wall biosynthesis